MISAKKYSVLIIFFIFFISSIVATFLYFIDTYSIRKPQKKTYYTIPNQRFLIIDYIISKKQYKNYNSYIFGSSRVGHINPLHIKNFNTYNMTYAEGIPHEHLLNIKLFIKEKIPLKHLLIGLDEFSYQVSFKSHDNMLGSKTHYLATQTSIFDFYRFYFLRKPSSTDIKHLKKMLNNKPLNKETNQRLYDEIYNQKQLHKNIKLPDTHNDRYKNNPKFSNPTAYIGNTLKETIQDIREIVKLAKENNIELHIFINPIHHTTYKFTNKTLLYKFRKKLAKITSYYDFSAPSYITKDNAYWYDTSHYNQNVGDMIISKIYDKNSSTATFGIFIQKTKSNQNKNKG